MSNITNITDPTELDLDERLLDVDYVQLLFEWDHLVYLFLIVGCIALGKLTYAFPYLLGERKLQQAHSDEGEAGAYVDKSGHFDLDLQLTDNDNKAVATSFGAYIVSIGLFLTGVLSDTPDDTGLAIMHVLIFTFIGFVLMFLAQIINDKLVLHRILNVRGNVEGNLATSLVEGGGFIANGLINGAVQVGGTNTIGEGIGKVVLFWVLGQSFFVAFAWVYRRLAGFNVSEEITKGNAAAGLAYGMTLAALGLLIANPLSKSDSLLPFVIMFFIGSLLLFITRVFVDKYVLSGEKLKEEIVNDSNWGAALVEGALAIGVVVCINSFLRWDPCTY